MADLAKTQQVVQSLSITGIRGLSVRQNGNLIEIHGQADSIAAKQSAMRAITDKVGDTGLVNQIQVAQRDQPQAAGASAIPSSQPAPGVQHAQERTHTVKKGETLSGIAQHYYGKASESKKLFEANRDKISDADKIREGMTIRIP